MRINQFIAAATGLSRREADTLIAAGRVKLNGQPAKLGMRLEPHDEVQLDDQVLTTKDALYLVLNKPVGYVCSRAKQGKSPTIYELLPKQYQHLKPVGRLDKDSQGLMLMTNDGWLTQQLTHPSHQKIKRYEVGLNRPLNDSDASRLELGVMLEDGPSRLTLERVDSAQLLISMSEGRNRQIRRTFIALGYKVVKLKRVEFGKLKLYDLGEGEYKLVGKAEIQ